MNISVDDLVKEVFGSTPKEYLVIGKRVRRYNALEMVLGRPLYLADKISELSGVVWLKTVRSTLAHAIIKGIDFSDALRMGGVVGVVTHSDIPGYKYVGYVAPDQPLLAIDRVRFYGEPIALVGAEEPEIAEEAAQTVKVEYEPLPVILDPLEAMKPDAIKIHDRGNVFAHFKIRRGDVSKGFSRADVIVENEYRTSQQEHAFIETEGAIAIPGPSGDITVIANAQEPYGAQKLVSQVLDMPRNKVRVIVPMIGGGFGGKVDIVMELCARAALAAFKFRRPTVLIHSREESIIGHTKRQNTILRYKHGATKDGYITAVEADLIYDSGAYASSTMFVLWRATVHSVGPYRVPNARVDGYAVYTNKVYAGAFRGFGNPEVAFAVERQMDELAKKLGMDPIEIRLKNMLREGDETVHGQVLDHSIGLPEILEYLRRTSGWDEKKRYSTLRRSSNLKRGIGFSIWWHGNSLGVEAPDYVAAYVLINNDGSVIYRPGLVDMGTGNLQGHAMIISEILGVPTDYIHVEPIDTSVIPESGPTVASRSTVVGGCAVLKAAYELRKRLNELAGELLKCRPSDVIIKAPDVYCRSNPNKKISWDELVKTAYASGVPMFAIGYHYVPRGKWDAETGRGAPYITYTYVGAVAEVEVDVETGKVKVLNLYGGFDAGKIINRAGAELQVEGGAVMALGYTLMERVIYDDSGRVMNKTLSTYLVPTIKDVKFDIKYEFIEKEFKKGALGAKALAEPAFLAWHTAIANAVADALGINVRELPITPEKVLKWIGALR